MPVFDENGKQVNGDEDFPKMKDPEDVKSNPMSAAKKFPIVPAVLGLVALIFAVVAVIFFLKANTLEQEVVLLKKAKAQLATTESKLNDLMKENQKFKAELTQVKGELDTVKAKNEALETQLANAKKKPEPKKPGDKKPGDKKPSDKKPGDKKPAPKKP